MANEQPAPAPGQQVQIGMAVQQRPNGKHVVVTNIGGEHFSFSFALPPDAAVEAGAKLADMYTQCADQARRADSGLIVSAPTIAKGLIKP